MSSQDDPPAPAPPPPPAPMAWMSVGEILYTQRAWLRCRSVPIQELLAVIGLAIGVALLFASQVASTSLDSSVTELTNRLVGSTQFQLGSRNQAGFSQALVTRVQRLPGVQLALPLLQQPATIIGPQGETSTDLVGASPGFLEAGSLPRRFSTNFLSRQEIVALPAGLAKSIGAHEFETLTLRVGATSQPVAGPVLGSSAGQLATSQLVLAPIAYAQKLAGAPGLITQIFVKVRRGQSAIATVSLQRLAARENLNLVPANYDARLFSVAAAPAQQGEGLFSAISAFVGFLFGFTAMLLTVPERRKFVRRMLDRGTTRGATIQYLCCEAALLGILATAVGLVLGELLSEHIFHSEPGYLSFAFPIGSQRVVTLMTIVLAMGVGVIAAFVGVFAPLRQDLLRAQRSLGEPEGDSWRWRMFAVIAGLLSLAITTLIVILRPQAAVLGNFTLLVALLCLLPTLFAGIVAAFDFIQRPLMSTATHLASKALREPETRSRAMAVAATGAIAVFGSVAISGARSNLQRGLDRTASEVNDATDIWVSPAGVNNTLGTTPFPSTVAQRITRIPVVRSVAIYRGGFLDLGDRRIWIIAPPRTSIRPIPPGQLTKGNLAQASQHLREGGWAVVSEAVAGEMSLHIGQRFLLPAPHPKVFRVAGLSTNGGWPPGAIIINASDYAEAWGSSAASAVMVSLRPSVSPALGRREVAGALGPNSGLSVQTSVGRARAWQTISSQGLDRLTQIARLVIIAAIIAMAGVMTSMIWQRRPAIAYVKRQGIEDSSVWLALFLESAVLLGAGCSIGAVFGMYGQLVISHALAVVTGFPIEFSTGTVIAVVCFAIVSAAALAIVAVPGRFASRIKPTLTAPT